MNATDRVVLVPARQLDDLLELTRLALDRLPASDPLVLHLRGASAAVRASTVPEP